MAGITSFGGYVPRYRLNRGAIYMAMGWMNPANIANARGEKAVANFDEDSITMAVAAGIDALTGMDRAKVNGVYFASTTLPYAERLNAGIINVALGLSDHVRAADFTGSLKAGTSALLSALDSVASGNAGQMMVAAADCRLGKPASAQEMIFGDAAAAFIVGQENVIAEFKGSYSTTYDFGDHFRASGAQYDRQWEDRWIRDLGFDQFLPEVVQGLLTKYNLKMSDFSRVVYDCHYAAARKKMSKVLGFDLAIDQKNFQEEIGHCGASQSLVMLAAALEDAKPGDKILVISYGSGCDALYFEVTDAILKLPKRNGISGSLARRAELDNYTKYLVWRDVLPVETGLRGEEDHWTRWSLMWRKRKEVLGLWGCKCKNCGTAQYPKQRICVNPDCNAVDEMEEYCFAAKAGKIASYTGDMLAASFNPPAIYGQIEFEGGGKYMFDFTDCTLDDLSTGATVRMSFRRKYDDKMRGISGYFWKVMPEKEEK